jgi:hypothetical protein
MGWPSNSVLMGILSRDIGTRFAEVRDGQSHTILIAEIAGKNKLYRRRLDTGTTLSGFVGGQGGWADATSAGSSLHGSTADGTTSPGPVGVNASNDYGLYAFHPAGANSVFADASVQFIQDQIDIAILAAVVTRANKEVNVDISK